VGGMTLISDGANQVSEYQLRMFSETWVEPVLRQLVALEQTYETDPIVFKFAGQNSQLFKTYNLSQIPDQLLSVDMNVSVNVGIGSTNPETQVRRFFYGMESLAKVVGPDQFAQRLDFEEVVKEAFGKLGYKDGKRFFNLDQEDPRIAQLQAQIEQLQQQLMMKRSPEVDAATAEKIRAEAVNSRVDAALKAMQAGQTIATIPAVAPVGDEILASAGFEDMNGPPVATPPEAGYSPPPRESHVRYIRENPIIEEEGGL
jgi:molybdopterin converting factor small subunit